MGLDQVKEEIMSKAKQDAVVLLKEGKDEADSIMKKAEGKVKESKEKIDSELNKLHESINKKEIAASELEIKKMFLEEKKKAVENVFSEVQKKIDDLSGKQREQHIKKLIEKAKKEIDVRYIYCSKKDKELIHDFEALEEDISGGIIAENENKDVRVDYSYETLLESIKEEYLQELGKVLFG